MSSATNPPARTLPRSLFATYPVTGIEKVAPKETVAPTKEKPVADTNSSTSTPTRAGWQTLRGKVQHYVS